MIHTIAGTENWNAIKTLCTINPKSSIASQNRPANLASSWCQNISEGWYSDGNELAAAIAGGLDRPDRPALVMIDEVRANSASKIALAADVLRITRPDLEFLWGAYLVNGEAVSYTNLQPAIDSLLRAKAIIAPEFYPKQSQYCKMGRRDEWLGEFFRGSRSGGAFPQSRLHYLMEHRKSLRSSSKIVPIFGVTKMYMNGPSPATFLDRIFYTFRNMSGYGWLLLQPGGAGSWKWDETTGILAESFVASWKWYCDAGLTSSRLGRVRCPQ